MPKSEDKIRHYAVRVGGTWHIATLVMGLEYSTNTDDHWSDAGPVWSEAGTTAHLGPWDAAEEVVRLPR